MKKILLTGSILLTAFIYSCGGNQEKNEAPASPEQVQSSPAETPTATGDEQGIGKFRNVNIDPALNAAMAGKGKEVYDMKCGSCHKLGSERLVGPGWQGITSRHRPEWIMNFATNVDEMLNKDPKAQAQLEICLVRMPNQNLTDDDARSVYEFMRQNDGVK